MFLYLGLRLIRSTMWYFITSTILTRSGVEFRFVTRSRTRQFVFRKEVVAVLLFLFVSASLCKVEPVATSAVKSCPSTPFCHNHTIRDLPTRYPRYIQTILRIKLWSGTDSNTSNWIVMSMYHVNVLDGVSQTVFRSPKAVHNNKHFIRETSNYNQGSPDFIMKNITISMFD